MEKKAEYNTESKRVGRPRKFSDPVEVWVRMERDMRDWLLNRYPGASSSSAVTTFIASTEEYDENEPSLK